MWSTFSGQQLYEAFIYQTYNMNCTGVSIMFYALFDFEFTKRALMDNPQYYEIGIKNTKFNHKRFWSWLMMGWV